MVALISGLAISGERLTITGTVNEDYEIAAEDGDTYEVKSKKWAMR